MQVIPLQSTMNQQVTVLLDLQGCQINVYQKVTGLFLDLYLENTLLLGGVLCRNLQLIVMNAYFGFQGDLMWLDNQGTNDPMVDGIGPGGRYSLVYLSADEVPTTSRYTQSW